MSVAHWINTDEMFSDKKYSFTDTLYKKFTTLHKKSEPEEHRINPAEGKVIAFPSSRLDRKSILIHDLGDPRVSLCKTLPIFVETWINQVTAYSYDLNEFGFAENESDAIRELQADIVDLYFLLRAEQEKLGPLPQQHWNFLKSIIQEN